MASMLFDRAPVGATVKELDSLRRKISDAICRLQQRRFSMGEPSFVIVGELLRCARTGSRFFMVQFPDKDTRAPKVIKKVVRQARLADCAARLYTWAQSDSERSSLGRSAA